MTDLRNILKCKHKNESTIQSYVPGRNVLQICSLCGSYRCLTPNSLYEPDWVRPKLLQEYIEKLILSKVDDEIIKSPNPHDDWDPLNLKYTGMLCEVCHEPQYITPSGDACKNDHGGAPSIPVPDGYYITEAGEVVKSVLTTEHFVDLDLD